MITKLSKKSILLDEMKLFETSVLIFYPLFGIIFFSNVVFISNFLLPLKNPIILIFCSIFIIFNFYNKFDFLKYKYIYLISIINLSILSISSYDINFQYDAGYYHLNYQNWLREEKLIFGLNNLNAAFLNGITHMGSVLVITDFSGRTLYSYNIDLGIHTELMSFNKNPNGIYYEQYNDVLYVVFWGGNAPIYMIDYEEGTYSELISTGLGNLDGIAVDQCGDIYISAWSTNAIHKYNADFTETELVISNLSYPADICINQYDNVLAIPNSGNNTVEFVDLLCDNSETPDLFQPKKILKKIDLLGRQSTGKGFNIELYEDGSVFKKYIF